MNCEMVKKATLAGANLSSEEAKHLKDCALCGRFVERHRLFEVGMKHHHAGHQPKADFSAKVVAHLPGPVELLGWASLRLLPVGFALLLFFSWQSLNVSPGVDSLLSPSTSDEVLLSFVLSGEGEGL